MAESQTPSEIFDELQAQLRGMGTAPGQPTSDGLTSNLENEISETLFSADQAQSPEVGVGAIDVSGTLDSIDQNVQELIAPVVNQTTSSNFDALGFAALSNTTTQAPATFTNDQLPLTATVDPYVAQEELDPVAKVKLELAKTKPAPVPKTVDEILAKLSGYGESDTDAQNEQVSSEPVETEGSDDSIATADDLGDMQDFDQTELPQEESGENPPNQHESLQRNSDAQVDTIPNVPSQHDQSIDHQPPTSETGTDAQAVAQQTAMIENQNDHPQIESTPEFDRLVNRNHFQQPPVPVAIVGQPVPIVPAEMHPTGEAIFSVQDFTEAKKGKLEPIPRAFEVDPDLFDVKTAEQIAEANPKIPYGDADPYSMIEPEDQPSDHSAKPTFDNSQLFVADIGDVIQVDGNEGFDFIDLACFKLQDAEFFPNRILIATDDGENFEIRHVNIDRAVFADDIEVDLHNK
ncbi:MAG: hypothetical protein AB8B55_14785 [Mariniblastus sp.]